MELFTDNDRTYKTRENAVVRAEKALKHYPRGRYVIAVNPEGRFYPVFIGSETFDLLHDGFCIAG